jgi:hypothetical protein
MAWYAPYDLEIGSLAIHAHKYMVNGVVDVVPANRPRLESSNSDCGGSKNGLAPHLLTTWYWDESYPCEYWRDPDRGVVTRKGEALRWTCTVNNGVTCNPNPAVDASGDPIDGSYENAARCKTGTGRCVPANIVFANVAEDEMCLLYGLYSPLERPVDASLDAARTGDAEHLLAIDQAGLESRRGSEPDPAHRPARRRLRAGGRRRHLRRLLEDGHPIVRRAPERRGERLPLLTRSPRGSAEARSGHAQ